MLSLSKHEGQRDLDNPTPARTTPLTLLQFRTAANLQQSVAWLHWRRILKDG
jgi:hypothetical protein